MVKSDATLGLRSGAVATASGRSTVGTEVIFANVSGDDVVAALQALAPGSSIRPETLGWVVSEYETSTGQKRTAISGALTAEGATSLASALSQIVPDAELLGITTTAFMTAAGSVVSDGDAAQRSDIARATYEVDGSGVTIGVLSDSYGSELRGDDSGDPTRTTVAQDIASGDLPNNVLVLQDGTSVAADGDEGRAMLQIIHDVAPGATLAFHTATGGQTAFANAIRALAAPTSQGGAGADVLVDDLFYFTEPIFMDGVISDAINEVTAAGVTYFSAAGNNRDDAFYDVFRDSGVDGDTIAAIDAVFTGNAGPLHDWNPNPSVFSPYVEMVVPVGEDFSLSFQWDEPYLRFGDFAPTSDLDIFITQVAAGTGEETLLTAGVADNVFGSGGDLRDPIEIVDVVNTEGSSPLRIRMYVTAFDPPDDVAANIMAGIFFSSAGGEFIETFDPKVIGNESTGALIDAPQFGASTVFGHVDAAGSIAVGAAAYFNTPAVNTGISQPFLNTFSSLGSYPVVFDPDGNRLLTPQTITGVDIVAPDGGNTTFFGDDLPSSFFDPDSAPNFFGTSAAAPHAAAVAALLLDQNPTLSPEEIESVLKSTAVPINFASDNRLVDALYTGAGLIDAAAALAAVPAYVSNEGIGTDGPDDLIGDGEANRFEGRGGNDTITGNGGNDTLIGGSGSDEILGGEGNDLLFGDDADPALLAEYGLA